MWSRSTCNAQTGSGAGPVCCTRCDFLLFCIRDKRKMEDCTDLVVGAGTTGLTVACELSRHGVPVRIIDKLASINPHRRATTLHARTLEIFYDLGIVEEILAQGNKVLGTSQFANGERFMHSSAAELEGPYPFTVMLEQCKTEAALEALLRTLGVEVERQTELIA